MARSVTLNLIGNNQTSRAFRGAADDADRLASRLDRAEKSADSSSRAFTALTSSTATMAAGLLAVAPAALAAGAAVVAGAGAMTAAFGSAAIALGAFGLAAKSQLSGVSNVSDAFTKVQDAQRQFGKGSKEAAEATKAYNKELAALPPATRQTAKAFIGLRGDFKAWSDSLAPVTMPIFTRGINVLREILPKLTKLVRIGAASLDDFMASIEDGVKGGGLDRFLGAVSDAAADSLPALLRSVKNVGVGIAGIFEAFLPHAGAMSRGVEGLTKRFAEWGKSLKTSESFKGFISYVKANLPALKTTFGNLVQIVINLAAAFAPMSGVSLELIKNFTGLLAALPPEVLTALATGFIAVTAAVRILTPVIRVLNFVMRLNPIGLVVLALAALVAGLIYAYKHSETFRNIVNKVWASVKSAVSTAWTKWIKPALQGLADLFVKAHDTWQKWWPELRAILEEVVVFFQEHLLGTINTIADGFGKIGKKAEEATGKIGGVGQGLTATEQDGNRFLSWGQVFATGIGTAIAGPLGGVASYITVTFWPEIKSGFTSGFKHLGSRATQFAKDFPAFVKNGLTHAKNNVVAGFRGLKKAFFDGLPPLRLSWSGFWNWTTAFLKRLVSTSLAALRNGLSLMREAFSRGVEAMKSAWRKLPPGVKQPINWVINVGYNQGIRALWNKVMGWLHLPGGLKLGHVPALASGGTLGAPAPARPFMTNGPTAIVGEGRKAYPEYVIPTDPRYRGRAQALWASAGGHLQMLAKGGVLGSVLGSVKKIAGKVSGIAKGGIDLLANPKGVWDRLAAQMVPSSGHLARDSWGTAMSRVVPSLLDRAWSAASQVISTFKKAFGGDASGVVKAAASMIGRGDDRGENNNWLTRAWGMPGAPWCAIFVSEAIKQARATKRYRGYPSAAVASYTAGMRHVGRGEGRPGDLGSYRGNGHINVIARNLGGGVYETIGGNEGPRVQRSRRGGQSAILRPMASGGVLGVYTQRNLDPADDRDPLLRALRGMRAGVFDSGGTLAPRSATLAINKTRHHEPIFPSLDAAAAYGGHDGPLVAIDQVIVRERADVDLLASRLGSTIRAVTF